MSAPPAPPVDQPAKKPAKPSLTKTQLERAAKLRDDGATWDGIRKALGVKLGSSAWFRAWEREGIEHRPAAPKHAKSAVAKPAPESSPAVEPVAAKPKPQAKPAKSRAAKKP